MLKAGIVGLLWQVHAIQCSHTLKRSKLSLLSIEPNGIVNVPDDRLEKRRAFNLKESFRPPSFVDIAGLVKGEQGERARQPVPSPSARLIYRQVVAALRANIHH